MHNFKSFAPKAEIVFDQGINVIIGPNGSGKTNVSDSLSFVLGRLSAKSMRAAKSSNLIFMGSKYVKPAHEASVELFLDNTDRSFSIDSNEVVIKRSIRKDGQGIYKINNETKTRTEVIELLAQAGIDPYGYNMIMQGQIQSVVKMHPEERRKIIEEVAGIAIYESRKEKSLHELEKTEEKLKEISTILRERTSFLKNLEKEKAQAQRFKDLELTVKRSKASILNRKLEDKKRELESAAKSISEKTEQKERIKEKASKIQIHIETLSEKINQINKHIQQASGLEQETLRNSIANLKAELEGLKVRKEGYENRYAEIERRIEEISRSIPDLEGEINNLRRESPQIAKKSQELKKKKDELAKIEEERKSILSLKAELNLIKERIKEKEHSLARVVAESESLLRNLEEYSINLIYKDESECKKSIEVLKNSLNSKKNILEDLNKAELYNEKIISISEIEIKRAEKIRSDVEKLDVCPLCQTKITQEHISHVFKSAYEQNSLAKEKLAHSTHDLEKIKEKKETILKEIKDIESRISFSEMELSKHHSIKDKKESLKRIVDHEKTLKFETLKLEEKRKHLELKAQDVNKIEELYHTKILEIEEISSRTEEDIDTTLLYKERELENINNVVKRSKEDLEDLQSSIEEISNNIESKLSLLTEKEDQEKKLNERFKKMFEDRERLQHESQENNLKLAETNNEVRQIEDQVNYLKIGQAQLDAQREAIEMEMSEFVGIELIKASIPSLEERLQKAQQDLYQIGSINLRALEVYEDVKKEYDAVQLRVDTIEKEKVDILKIVEEIDKKKTREFMKTFRVVNEIFTRNFSKLSAKGTAYLEIENPEDIFSAGVNIVVKLAKGKYFDVTSLSGGEQTLVALSLLFAIQEHKPYHFYVFDEIDAALDKRNSERLAALLNQYMKAGQYIVITHNDAIILNSNVLYGISMHDGVSKILSLKVS